ncbi:hypothetical protein GCM10027269_19510 [Kribbella endophytica]
MQNQDVMLKHRRYRAAAARDSLLDWLYRNPEHEGDITGLLKSSHRYFFLDTLQATDYNSAIDYLSERGLLRTATGKNGLQVLKLTAIGDDCARDELGSEKWLEEKGYMMMQNGDHITTNIGVNSQSPINIKSSHVDQSSNVLTPESQKEVLQVVDVLQSLLAHPDAASNKGELVRLLGEMKSEVTAEMPHAGRVRAVWDRLLPKLIDSTPSIAKIVAQLALPDVLGK